MKDFYYIQFFQTINGYYHEAMGSDSILKVDGRLSFENMKYKARKKASEFYLANIQDYSGFAIVRTKNGRYQNAHGNYPIYKIGGAE